MNTSTPPFDFWLKLYEEHPELFELVEKSGKKGLKILPDKFKKLFKKIKKIINKEGMNNLLPLLDEEESKKYLNLKNLSYNERFADLKRYLSPLDWRLFIMGQEAKACNFAGDLNGAKKIKKDGLNRWGYRAVIIINWVIQGYFDELIIPILKDIINKYEDNENKIYEIFNKILGELIDFFPRAIWVSNDTSKVVITKELYLRAATYGYRFINIHTINKYNVEKVETVLKELSKDPSFPNFEWRKEMEFGRERMVTFNIKIL